MCDAIYPFVGGTASKHSHNLKSSTFQITWSGTLTHDANGVTGDGSSGYGNTGLDLKNNGVTYTMNSAHMFVYGGTTAPTDNGVFIGGYRYSGTLSRTFFNRNGANLEMHGINNNFGSSAATSASTDFRGPLIASRTASTVQALAVRSTWATGDTTTTVESPNAPCGLLARLDQDGNADRFSSANLRAATIGAGPPNPNGIRSEPIGTISKTPSAAKSHKLRPTTA